ncbi:MAG: hypothetical protein AAF580_08325 [Pseudomonadota bacterium]
MYAPYPADFHTLTGPTTRQDGLGRREANVGMTGLSGAEVQALSPRAVPDRIESFAPEKPPAFQRSGHFARADCGAKCPSETGAVVVDPEYGPAPGDLYHHPYDHILYVDHVNYSDSLYPYWRYVTVSSAGSIQLTSGGEFRNELIFSHSQGHKSYYRVYTEIIGSAEDDVIWGMGMIDFQNADPYYHNDLIHGGDGNDWISGGWGEDTLSGGAGNDTLLGGEWNDLLYGGAGNDLIEGGSGLDQLYGGSGNDVLVGGDADLLDGGSGHDWLFGAASGWGGDTMVGGTGHDVFVMTDGNNPHTPPSQGQVENGGNIDDLLWDVGEAIPILGGIVKVFRNSLDLLAGLGGKGNTAWAEPDAHNAATISDFNPLHDAIIIEADPNISLLPSLEFGTFADPNVAFRIKDGNGNYLAEVSWADLADWLHEHIDLTDGDTRRAFEDHIRKTMLLIDVKDGVVSATDGDGVSVTLDEAGASALEDGRYVLIGGYEGVLRTGGDKVDLLFGTDHNDVLFGYGATGTSDAGVHDDKLWGFGGNDLLDGGAGWNFLYGGDGEDTSSYATASSGVVVDLSQRDADGYSIARSTYHNSNGDGGNAVDYLSEIEHIIGSEHADSIVGDEHGNHLQGLGGNDQLSGGAGDDTLDSGMGFDTLTGGSGADSFRLTGGENTITDWGGDEGDRVQVDMGAYGVNALSDLAFIPHENGAPGGRLVVAGTGDIIAIVEGVNAQDFDIGAHVDLLNEDGEVVNVQQDDDASNSTVEEPRDNSIYSYGGNDTSPSSDGNDSLFGGSGYDHLHTGAGDDLLFL